MKYIYYVIAAILIGGVIFVTLSYSRKFGASANQICIDQSNVVQRVMKKYSLVSQTQGYIWQIEIKNLAKYPLFYILEPTPALNGEKPSISGTIFEDSVKFNTVSFNEIEPLKTKFITTTFATKMPSALVVYVNKPFDRKIVLSNTKTHNELNNLNAVDINSYFGEYVNSPVDGVIVMVQDGFEDYVCNDKRESRNYANTLTILDSNGYAHVLVHLKRGSIKVHEGQIVKIGQQLGQIGMSGYTSGPHLHYQVEARGERHVSSLKIQFKEY